MFGIKAIAPFFPGKSVSAQDLPDRQGLPETEGEYYDTVGVKSIFVADDHKAYDLALGASKKLLDETGLQGQDIDLIIYIKPRLPEYLISSEAARLQKDLEAPKALCYAISDLGCADMSMAVKQAMDFLKANRSAENVLIAYGCRKYAPRRFRYPVTITGDGGLALMIGRTEDNEILDVEIQVDGNYWDLFKLDYVDKRYEELQEECSNVRKYGFELAIESKNRFQELNKEVLERNDLEKGDIQHFLLQNISARAYEFYQMAFDVKISPVCGVNLGQYGHLGPSDVILNVHTGLANGLFQKGERLLVMNNSPVAVWSSILIQI